MKIMELVGFMRRPFAPFSGQCRASFARSAKNALEISEKIELK